MTLKPWSEIPADFYPEFNFHRGPLWLRVLARTPVLDRYAYPIAMKKGLCDLWPTNEQASLDDDFARGNWIIKDHPKNRLDRWFEGSVALLGQGEKNPVTQFLYRDRKIQFGETHAIFWSVIPRITFTRYGAILKRRHAIHRFNGTYKDYKKALHGERFDFSE